MLLCFAYPEASVSSFLHSAIVAVFLLLSPQTIAFGDDDKPPAASPELAAADQLYRAGKFAALSLLILAMLIWLFTALLFARHGAPAVGPILPPGR